MRMLRLFSALASALFNVRIDMPPPKRTSIGCECLYCRRMRGESTRQRTETRVQPAFPEPMPKAVSRRAAQLLKVTRKRMSTVATKY